MDKNNQKSQLEGRKTLKIIPSREACTSLRDTHSSRFTQSVTFAFFHCDSPLFLFLAHSGPISSLRTQHSTCCIYHLLLQKAFFVTCCFVTLPGYRTCTFPPISNPQIGMKTWWNVVSLLRWRSKTINPWLGPLADSILVGSGEEHLINAQNLRTIFPGSKSLKARGEIPPNKAKSLTERWFSYWNRIY